MDGSGGDDFIELEPEDWQDEEFKKDVADAIKRAKERARKRALERLKSAISEKGSSEEIIGSAANGSISVSKAASVMGGTPVRDGISSSVGDSVPKAEKGDPIKTAKASAAGSGSAVSSPKSTDIGKSSGVGAVGTRAVNRFALVIYHLDNLVLNNYDRILQTYLKLGWDEASIREFLSHKENLFGKIAKFNTPKVSFTASSRRNRYYEVYNSPEMLEYDKPYPYVVEALNTLYEDFEIFIISDRTEELKEKTLEVMQKHGFPMDRLHIYFKKVHTQMRLYKKECIIEIKSSYPGGIGLIILPSEAQIFKMFNYTPIGVTTVKDAADFADVVPAVCNNWEEIVRTIKQT